MKIFWHFSCRKPPRDLSVEGRYCDHNIAHKMAAVSPASSFEVRSATRKSLVFCVRPLASMKKKKKMIGQVKEPKLFFFVKFRDEHLALP